jgi:TRAP-type C4-dicarboxylate transport system substrate-binding protein
VRALFVIVLTVFLAACDTAPPPGVTILTYGSPYAPGHPFSRSDVTWMKWIEAESNGTLKVKPFWSGSLLSSEHAMTELRHGVADVGLITPIYARGGTHMIRAQAGFYGGATTFDEQVAMYRCMEATDPQFGHELRGLKVLAVQGGNLPVIITRDRPVKSLRDLQGLRLRAPSELLAVLEHFGADPVDMPMRDVYPALAKGVLDGVVAPMDTFRSLHFSEVTRYVTQIAIPRGAYAGRAMGERRWNSLSPEHRRILEASIEVWEEALERELLAAENAGIQAARDAGVVFNAVSAEDQAAFDEVYARDGEARARDLARYGIDGMKSFKRARAYAAQLGSPSPTCPGLDERYTDATKASAAAVDAKESM